MNDVPDIWAAARVAFEGRGAHGGWVGSELAHFILHIPSALKRQIGGAI